MATTLKEVKILKENFNLLRNEQIQHHHHVTHRLDVLAMTAYRTLHGTTPEIFLSCQTPITEEELCSTFILYGLPNTFLWVFFLLFGWGWNN